MTLTDGTDFALVVEKLSWAHSQCGLGPNSAEFSVAAEDMVVQLAGAWIDITSLNAWRTQFGWDGLLQTNSSFFEPLPPIDVVNGRFVVNIQPDALYTFTTRSAGFKAPIPSPPPAAPFPTTYADNFEGYNVSSEARYFTDQAGSFEIVDSGASHGLVMRQMAPLLPICWSSDFAPFSVIGDTKWSDTLVSVSVLIEATGAAYVGARSSGCFDWSCYSLGVYFSVSVLSQQWALAMSIDVENPSQIYVSGSYSVEPNTWYNLTLSVVGSTAHAWLDGVLVVESFALPVVAVGWAAIGTSVQANNIYTLAQFDNFTVSASQLTCPAPAAGQPLISMWCDGACMAL